MSTISRRQFLRLGAISSMGLLIGIPVSRPAHAGSGDAWLHPLIRVRSDGGITLYAQNPEIGQGVKTSLPMIVADELGVDWHAITVEQADWNRALENQFAGGSLSIRLNYEAMLKAGASAREMLVAAAAERWQAEPDALRVSEGHVVNTATGERLPFANLAAAAAQLPVPENPQLKSDSDYRLIGKPLADVDLPRIIDGTQIYSLDLKLPGMLYAVVVRCPQSDGQPESFDDSAAKEVPGVSGFRMIRNDRHGGRVILPNCPNFVSGVAVLAENTWAAMQAARLLEVNWKRPATRDDTSVLMGRFEMALASDRGELVRKDGDPSRIGETEAVRIDATYRLPFLAHMTMEPMNCTAAFSGDRLEVWAPTQEPGMAAEAAARALAIDPGQVTVHVMRSGGGFGRRFYADFVVDAAILARDAGRPVKVVWTREDDLHYDYFRPASLQRVRAGVDGSGKLVRWDHKVVSHPRSVYLEREGSPAEIGDYEFPAGFVPNLLYEYSPVSARIPLGQWRSVDHSSNVFVVSSVIDELAHAGGRDPLAFWLSLLGSEPFVQVREDFRFDASRLRQVIMAAARAADWGAPMPKGRGKGLAASYNQGSWVAEVAEVTVGGKALKVDRIVAAVDCGRLINPSGARKQVEGAVIEGLGAALFGEVTVRDGIVEQDNFDQYRICRLSDVPPIEVTFIERRDAPRGLGEPPLPPVAPAVCNAIFAASGVRIRELPLKHRFSV
jgi:isoquinoline 1-oxidoreductase subunit beta